MSASVGFIIKKFVTMDGHMNGKMQFTCKGKLSRGDCSLLSVDISCLTAVLQNTNQVVDKRRPKAYADWAVKPFDTNQNPIIIHSMQQNSF
jgi:hypothetical protein